MLTPQDVKLISDVVRDQVEASETRMEKKVRQIVVDEFSKPDGAVEKKMREVVTEAINNLLIPAMDETEEEINIKLDDHEKRIKRLEASKIN